MPFIASGNFRPNSGVSHEVRTIHSPRLHDEDEIRTLARHLNRAGVTHYAVQVFRSPGCRDETLNNMRVSNYPGASLIAELESLFPSFTLRSQ